ncbi:Gfo/Idh/MocA family oxidoreductase [Crossiella sp. SN42]|uniref:Gfo/Idh/MocA family protein n=1 Tax=Crossiella sp. SN42 TaxID=2944808 RepID=UPI00207D51EA|nr:Gfo/Idh/MocA family oxidoreductase [Crossiella sp. SN42]MCO1581505.1 Gfo/Idh/MocA family oxidoreductase [Crossiella sp. SN42]
MRKPLTHKRYALIGTGNRATVFLRALTVEHTGTAELVALADVNRTRMAAHNRRLAGLGAAPVPEYPAEDFLAMLDREAVDTVLVTTVDRTHDEYITAALRAGRDVITEKPMTTDPERCQRILDAVADTGRTVTVAFNYRYQPVFERLKQIIAAGEIGEVGSVHFEWLLDTRHGADYFRRWHRDKANSGGLLVHKATHHFDLVNWWLDTEPAEVYAQGRLFFYGPDNLRRHGQDPAAFRLDLTEDPWLRELYHEAAHEDGYRRDQDVFAPGVSIEDDLAVLARYRSGATLTYHLTAYAPWEGVRVMVNGSKGRAELEVVEADPGGQPHASLWVRRFWQPPQQVPVSAEEGHASADRRLCAALFGAETEDSTGKRADHLAGARSLLTGFAANRSLVTGGPVRTNELGVRL